MHYDSIPSSWLPIRVGLDLPIHEGKVVEWFRGEGEVYFNDPLCKIEWDLGLGIGIIVEEVSSPAFGLLHIVKEVGDEVDERDNIVAYIEPRFKA